MTFDALSHDRELKLYSRLLSSYIYEELSFKKIYGIDHKYYSYLFIIIICITSLINFLR